MEDEASIWNFLENFTSSSSSMTRSQSSSYYDPFGYNFWTPSRVDKELMNSNKKSSSSSSPVPTFQPPSNFRLNLSYYHNNNNNNLNNNTNSTSGVKNNHNSHNNQSTSRDFNSSMMDLNNNGTEGYYFNKSPGPGRLNNNSSSSRTSVTSEKYLCVFCKSNNEPESIYRSHPLRLNQIVVCPSLRNYTCCICKATGDNAHTIKYCPYNKRGFYATRSHEKCNTNNNSKYRMKVHLVDTMGDPCGHHHEAKSSSGMNQQDKETFHRRHFRPIPMSTPSSESDDDTFNFEPPPVKTNTANRFNGSRSSSSSSSSGTLNHQLVFFNRTMQKSRS